MKKLRFGAILGLTVVCMLLAIPAVIGAGISVQDDSVYWRNDQMVKEHKYHFGEPIVFRGRNDGIGPSLIYITGPNLPAEGVPLTDFNQKGYANYAEVKADHSWEFIWNSSILVEDPKNFENLDAGDFVIHVQDRVDTSITNSIPIKMTLPFIYGTINPLVVKKGEEVLISGWAAGKPSEVNIWIFGDSYRELSIPVRVEDNGVFKYTFNTGTSNIQKGDYYIIVQHPMYNEKFDVVAVSNSRIVDSNGEISIVGMNAKDAMNTSLYEILSVGDGDDLAIPSRVNPEFKFTVSSDSILVSISSKAPTIPILAPLTPEAIITNGNDEVPNTVTQSITGATPPVSPQTQIPSVTTSPPTTKSSGFGILLVCIGILSAILVLRKNK